MNAALPAAHFHFLTVFLLLLQQFSTVQSNSCSPDNNKPCDIFIAWQGCFKVDSLKAPKKVEYEELFRDPANINQTYHDWATNISSLVCRCANYSLQLQYEFFAIKFYSACFGGAILFDTEDQDDDVCLTINDANCKKNNHSKCFSVGFEGLAVYKIIGENSTIDKTQCSGNKIVDGGAYVNAKTMAYKTGRATTNATEDSKTTLLRMFKELDNCFDINQILQIIKKIIRIFKRPEIFRNFGLFKELQASFVTTLSKIVGEDYKHLWKKFVKVQYLVEMVQDMPVLTLLSLSFTNQREYSLQTSNIDISANLSSDETTSLYFNDTTSGSFITFENSGFRGITSRRPTSIAAILYKSIHDIFPAKRNHNQGISSNKSLSVIASPVVSIVSMHDGKLIKDINGTIRLKKIAEKRESSQIRKNYSCVFWKNESSLALGGTWSTAGLTLSTDNFHGNQSNANNTEYFTCRTSHFTSFAILMQVTDIEIPREHKFTLEMITYFGCSLSLLCLLLTIITIPIIRLKETRFMIHLHLCIALAASQGMFLAGISAIGNHTTCHSLGFYVFVSRKHELEIMTACMLTAMFLHYFYTAAFMLMLVEGIHLYQKVVIAYQVQNVKEKFYFLFAWAFPLIIVGIAFAANREGYGTDKGCWLSLEKGFRWAFITPVLVVLLANFVILIKVLFVMVSLQSDPLRPENHGKVRLACKGVAILLPLLGLTWFFGIMSVNSDTIVFQYLFAIFNSLQGAFIFVFNYASNKEVRMSFLRTIQRSQMSSLL